MDAFERSWHSLYRFDMIIINLINTVIDITTAGNISHIGSAAHVPMSARDTNDLSESFN
jgi:hypothetical protein